MAPDVTQPVGREVELARFDLSPLRDAICEVRIGIQIVARVRASELHSIDATLAIVEGLENQRGTELTLIDEIDGLLVVGIDPNVQAWEDLLRHTGIEIMIPLR